MTMFNKQYRFKGEHARRVDQLTNVFDEISKAKLFERNIDVYVNAPLVGFLYGRSAPLDNSKNPETGQVYDQNIFGDRVIQSGNELLFNFRLIMLLDSQYEKDKVKRIDKAFRHMGKEPADEEHYDGYVRGGVDVLYEKLVIGSTEPEDYVMKLYDFIEEFDERFNWEIDIGKLFELIN